MNKKRILIIDDEEDFCRMVKKSLELITDFEIVIATNGKKGIKAAKEIKPDLILLDIVMPGINGLEVLKRLKGHKNTMEAAIPVVMLTSRDDEACKIKSAQLYDEEYITKPIEAPDLKAKIEEVFRRIGVR